MFLYWIMNLILEFAPTSQAVALSKNWVDMTYVFDNYTHHWPTERKFQITLKTNRTSGGRSSNETQWHQGEEYTSSSHVGTHIDAPRRVTRGRWGVDEIPLSRLEAPAAVVDITQRAEQEPEAEVQVDDLRKWENRTGQHLNGTVVLVRTGWGSHWSNRTAFLGINGTDSRRMRFPGMAPAAAQWLVENRNVYGVGTEALSIDKGSSKDFRVHKLLLDANVYVLENVANMSELPVYGATLHVMPMKISKASGAPTRVAASYPEVIFPQRRKRTVTENILREIIVFS